MLINKVQSVIAVSDAPRVLVIGDIMVDHYLIGKAHRLSPEAPVPVVNLKSETSTLGGAGNVVQNLVSLGAKVTVFAITGNDAAAAQVTDLLKASEVATDTIIKIAGRPTTIKTRIIVDGHQLARIDKESVLNLDATEEDAFIDMLTPFMNDTDIVLLSDYNKGLFSPGLTRRIINVARKANKRVVVDPKGNNFTKYNGAFIIKPNRSELSVATKMDNLDTVNDLQIAADILLQQTEAEHLVVTLSEEGILIFNKNGRTALPVKATEVFDVTGAGDTVLATIAFFLSLGVDLETSCELANHAAAVVIRQMGSATTTVDEILADIENNAKNLQRLK